MYYNVLTKGLPLPCDNLGHHEVWPLLAKPNTNHTCKVYSVMYTMLHIISIHYKAA